jgi:CMP-N,N'-diacetyllegionaminic acid synthase
MNQHEKILTIIPTRGGSEGIRNKNIFLFEGMPLVAHTILEALKCSILSDIFVTTDSDEIEAVAKEYGAQIFRHPSELSIQGKQTAPVIQYVANEISGSNPQFGFVAVLRATSPLRNATDISNAYSLMINKNGDSVVSLEQQNTMHPVRLKTIDGDGHVRDVQRGEEGKPIRRQDLPDVYRRTGAIYIALLDIVLGGRMWGDKCVGYVMPQERAININTYWDLITAAAYYRAINGNEFGEYLQK